MAIKLIYRDIPVGIEGNITSTANLQKTFSKINDIDKTETDIKNYGTLAGNNWSLSSNVKILPDSVANVDIGYWSNTISNSDGTFETNPIITRVYTGSFTSTGLTIQFDTYNNVFPTDVNIKWYRDSTLLDDKNFTPTSATFFFQNNVIAYNKIVITFDALNKSNRYLRIFKIIDGAIREFYSDEVSNITINESVSATGDSLEINTMSCEIISKSPIKMLFQRVQSIDVYNNDDFYGSFFVNSSSRTNNLYKLETYDNVGMLDNDNFNGGIYNNVQAQTLIASIMKDIPYEIENSLKTKLISGYLPIDTCRNSLMQVAFAINAVVDTSRKDKVYIYAEKTNPTYKLIDETKIGSDFTEQSNPPYTSIELIEHKYIEMPDESEIYNDTLNGTITITFSEPMHSLRIVNGTINDSGTNYATITGTGSIVELYGANYSDVKNVKKFINPENTTTSIPNIVTFENATLINSDNSTSVANRLKKIMFTNTTFDVEFLATDEVVGDYVELYNEDGNVRGEIISLEYDLISNQLWCKCTVAEVKDE